MKLNFLDKKEYEGIPLYKIQLDGGENSPIFLGKYNTARLPTPFHRHEYMQINYIFQGKMKHVINQSEFDVVKGDIFVIPPYVPHRIIEPQSPDGEVVEFEFMPEFIISGYSSYENIKSFFDFAYIEPFLVSENQVKPRMNLAGKIEMEVESLINEALDEYNSKVSGYSLVIKSLLLKLLVLVGREFTRELDNTKTDHLFSRHRDAIIHSVEYINGNYMKDIGIEDAARISLLSQSYFSYLFKSVTSKTFVEYLNGIRLSKAMELLRGTDLRVIDICHEVGFNNINHFNKQFRQNTGVSPLLYRKNAR